NNGACCEGEPLKSNVIEAAKAAEVVVKAIVAAPAVAMDILFKMDETDISIVPVNG
ncbi:MAG: hypothetical protein HC917_21970, partial [Richelia sp. SM2_1_7]|nr:hypothetical protein [Richelia sp. SM2_1_7]